MYIYTSLHAPDGGLRPFLILGLCLTTDGQWLPLHTSHHWNQFTPSLKESSIADLSRPTPSSHFIFHIHFTDIQVSHHKEEIDHLHINSIFLHHQQLLIFRLRTQHYCPAWFATFRNQLWNGTTRPSPPNTSMHSLASDTKTLPMLHKALYFFSHQVCATS